MRSRRWSWLRSRIIGLLSTDSRIYRDLHPPQQHPSGGSGGDD